MYIKYVRIHGFKSYREKTVCGPLSPMHNSIVGYNGSGKSNFFAALRFVLSDSYSNMRPEERAKLLNEGAGAAVVQAYVEIVFDNSDHRLDNDKDEVTIKRQIGLKKDEYFVDQKHVTKQDIANMLETAGFSKSNPYYIVEQGKVTKITEMSDKLRLDLLKEVAGTNVYEEKKEESLKIMKESDTKMAEIIKNLDMIESRLAKLDKEKEELSQYYTLDKERRSLHHALLSQKIKGLHEDLTGIDREKAELKVDSAEGDEAQQVLEGRRAELDREFETLSARLEKVEFDKAALEVEEGELLSEEYAQQDVVNRMVKGLNRDQKELGEKQGRAGKLQAAVEEEKRRLAGLEPAIVAKTAEFDRTAEEYNKVDRKVETLNSVSSGQAYSSKGQRDAALQKDIGNYEKTIEQRQAAGAKAEKELARDRGKAEQGEELVRSLKGGIDSRKGRGQQGARDQQKLETKRLDNQKQMKVFQASQAEILKETEEAERDIHQDQQKLNQGASSKTLRFLSKYVEDNKIAGYYGPLIDIFKCNDVYNTAVEQAAGARLYNAVVEDDAVASVLMDALRKTKMGRMQFLPLRKLRPHVPDFPQDVRDSQPVIACLQYEDRFKPAILEVFGKTFLCATLEIASDVRRSHGLTCVTMDGSKIARKGAMKGGYHDASQSSIRLQKRVTEQTAKLERSTREKAELAKKITACEQTESRLMGELQKLKNEVSGGDQANATDNRQIGSTTDEVEYLKSNMKAKEQYLRKTKEEVGELEHKAATLRDQIAVPFAQVLSSQQEAELAQLTVQLTELNKLRTKQSRAIQDAERDRDIMTTDVQAKQKQLDELQTDLEELQRTAASEPLELEQMRFQTCKEKTQACTENKDKKDKEKSDVKSKKDSADSELKSVRSKLKNQAGSFERARKKLDQLMDKKNRLMTEMDSAQAQLRDLGSLPQAFDKYKDKSQKHLHDELHKVTEKLKGFKDVNKKALDQFNQFTEQREKFRERKEELERGASSIRELIRKLDEKKDDALQTTYRMVAKNFEKVFARIVPGGSGELVMKTADVAREGEEDGASAGPRRNYVGVQVKVRFAAGGEVRVMRALSGGQKSVVALAIIFAIQKCDPAPFYLFDEVDANLDPMYRAAVAAMITAQKTGDSSTEGGVQFITSSFQPELVQAADCHWLTTHSGMSRIVQGSLEDQLDIVRRNQQTAAQGASNLQ
mmetsp:Transcript_51571/g.122163  ORF Transcript_51571/g.122163 Transcript_51571/m.122163 type:complete len:1202 (+) Transcript_51571:76-3681(+)